MSERDEFESRVDDLVERSFVVTDGPKHPFSKGGETWAERDAVVRVVLADVAARAPQAVPALTEPVAWMTPSDWEKAPHVTADASLAKAWKRDSREVTPLYAAP